MVLFGTHREVVLDNNKYIILKLTNQYSIIKTDAEYNNKETLFEEINTYKGAERLLSAYLKAEEGVDLTYCRVGVHKKIMNGYLIDQNDEEVLL